MDITVNNVYVDKRGNDFINVITYIFSNKLKISTYLNPDIPEHLEIILCDDRTSIKIVYRPEESAIFDIHIRNVNDVLVGIHLFHDLVSAIQYLVNYLNKPEFHENFEQVKEYLL